MTKLLDHFKHNLVAYLALFVAMGGTSYAAVNLPAGSVGSKQLRNGVVTNRKLAKGSVGAADLDRNSIAGYVRDWAKITSDGIVFGSRPRAHLANWSEQAGDAGGFVSWGKPIPTACFAEASTGFVGRTSSYASAAVLSAPDKNAGAYVHLSTSGTPVNVVVICPQP